MNKFVHVMPLDDVISHEGTPDCICGPAGQIVSAADLLEDPDLDGVVDADDLTGFEDEDLPDGAYSPDTGADDWDRADGLEQADDDEGPEGDPRLAVCIIIYHHYALRPCHEWEASPEP
ncbi:hypothetical protein GCM10023194_19930 [Planotetraspora phitsanulokensis]|uniref:Uncharacterized protein n=1 Tax=Planotetraspora phitsanulokensis TaxID=575192 RepID=A0A8J3U9N3_9ACTN|nr:hypothetical protein [Planotetraspora phitsanulokensis]GII39376.1 hypothetical protein Pph01_43790 [Planotetraspora phitsanulokensis]